MGQALRKNGTSYDPRYIDGVNPKSCIGCGRCYKVCGQEVFTLVERSDAMNDNEDDDFEDDGAMVMTLKNDGNCIGCEACFRVCPKGCHSFANAA